MATPLPSTEQGGMQWVTRGFLSTEATFGDEDYNHAIWKVPGLCQNELYTYTLSPPLPLPFKALSFPNL